MVHYISVKEFQEAANETLIDWGIPDMYLVDHNEAFYYLENDLTVQDAVRDAAYAFHYHLERNYTDAKPSEDEHCSNDFAR